MAGAYYTQVTLEHDSALPEDRTVNVWAMVVTGGVDLTELALWHAALLNFYVAVDQLLSSSLSGIGSIKSYKRSDPQPRVPLLSTSIALNYATTAMPAEVALCLSFQAVAVAGLPQARRRGRIYLGPFGTASEDDSNGRPIAGTVATVTAAGDALVTASKAAANWKWEVWSTVNGAGQNVDNGWVDNAWDTQRRRGLRPTSRSLFS